MQRSWIIAPCLLQVAALEDASTIHLIEIGSSAGLNLGVDRYCHRYLNGCYGDSSSILRLFGPERSPVPSELLATRFDVGRRIGIDLAPLDPHDEQTVRLLRAFTWPGRDDRLERLGKALSLIESVAIDVVQGSWELTLPEVLRKHRRVSAGEVTVLFETAALGYGGTEAREHVRQIVQAASERNPMPLYLLQALPSISDGVCFELNLDCFSCGRPRPRWWLGTADIHGDWIRWGAPPSDQLLREDDGE